MPKPEKSILTYSFKDMLSSNKKNTPDVLTEFKKMFSDADDMWAQMSTSYDMMRTRDPEMSSAIIQLANTIVKFEEIKKDIPELATNIKDTQIIELQNYSFILFTILKNLEHLGLVKINHRPERIVKSAIKTYEKKHYTKTPPKGKKK